MTSGRREGACPQKVFPIHFESVEIGAMQEQGGPWITAAWPYHSSLKPHYTFSSALNKSLPVTASIRGGPDAPSTLWERKLRFHNLPPTACKGSDNHRTTIFLKNFSKRGSRNGTFNDINNRGMKRPHEMMNLISKRPSSISAVRRRAGERRDIRKFYFLSLCFWKPGRESDENVRKMKTEKQ